MDNDVRKRLEEKFGKNVRTGGKGTVRRKVKKKSRIVSTHISQEEKEYNQLVSKCNDKIQSIENNDEISLWNHHIRDCFFEFLEKSNKKYFNKKNEYFVNLEDNEDERYLEFIDNILIDVDDYMLINLAYSYIKELLNSNGYEIFINYLEDIIVDLDKKYYLPNDMEEKEDVNINELLKILDLDINEIPSKEKLRKAYFKISSKVHPDKHLDDKDNYTKIFSKVSDAYHYLLEYYYPKKKSNGN